MSDQIAITWLRKALQYPILYLSYKIIKLKKNKNKIRNPSVIEIKKQRKLKYILPSHHNDFLLLDYCLIVGFHPKYNKWKPIRYLLIFVQK